MYLCFLPEAPAEKQIVGVRHPITVAGENLAVQSPEGAVVEQLCSSGDKPTSPFVLVLVHITLVSSPPICKLGISKILRLVGLWHYLNDQVRNEIRPVHESIWVR